MNISWYYWLIILVLGFIALMGVMVVLVERTMKPPIKPPPEAPDYMAWLSRNERK